VNGIRLQNLRQTDYSDFLLFGDRQIFIERYKVEPEYPNSRQIGWTISLRCPAGHAAFKVGMSSHYGSRGVREYNVLRFGSHKVPEQSKIFFKRLNPHLTQEPDSWFAREVGCELFFLYL
jgi:hypothetical protein